MIDYDNRIIHVDFSTLARFKACKEKARLESVNGWAARVQKVSLSFGHALHAGIAAYYDALAGGYRDAAGWHVFNEPRSPLREAQAAFLRDLKIEDAVIPVGIVGDERRSLERGIGLIEAYVARYADELYENILDAAGAPLVEVGFGIELCDFIALDGTKWQIRYCGFIDRIMRSRMTGRPTMIEFKHTTQALPRYIQQCKPNHQITGYFPYAQHLFPDLRECEWDCVYVSSRKPDMGRAVRERFMMYGIDIKEDFKRIPTSRSQSDIDAWRQDTIDDAQEFARWLLSARTRWPRSAPGACHTYDGCMFRDRCSLNLDMIQEQNYMNERFVVRKWEPWKHIRSA